MRGTTWPFGLAVGALVLGALLVIPRKPPDLGVQPPRLRIRGSPLCERERYCVLTIVTADGREDRFLFEKGQDDRCAMILCADPDAPAWEVLAAAWKRALEGEVWPRFYLGGTGPDGSLVALPMFLGTRLEENQVRCLGYTIHASYRWGSSYSTGVFEVRVTREVGGTRFRWGRSPFCKSGDARRWTAGDVTLSDEVVAAEGRGPLLPGLAELLTERFVVNDRCLAIVTLEIGTGVRNIDLVRVIECGDGDPDIWFVPQYVGQGELPRVGTLELGAPEDAALLEENLRIIDRPTVTVTEEGLLRRKSETYEPEEFPVEGYKTLQLHADERAPWDRCLRLLRRAQAAGLGIDFVFAPEDRQIRWERVLHVPLAKDGERLDLPPGASAGEAFRAVLRRLREGTTAFSFE